MKLILNLTFEDESLESIVYASENGLSFEECLKRSIDVVEEESRERPETQLGPIKSFMVFISPDQEEVNEV